MRKNPSTNASALAAALLWYPLKTPMPLTRISPSSATRMVVPGTGMPTVPTLVRVGVLAVHGAVVSVRP